MKIWHVNAKSHKGTSLIEVMITVLVIAVSVVALIRFQTYLTYDSSLVKQRSEATVLAQRQLENIMTFQTLTTTTGYTSYESIASGSGSQTISGTSYTITWTVTSNTYPTYKNINVTVAWTDRYGGAQSVQMASDLAGIEPAFSALIY